MKLSRFILFSSKRAEDAKKGDMLSFSLFGYEAPQGKSVEVVSSLMSRPHRFFMVRMSKSRQMNYPGYLAPLSFFLYGEFMSYFICSGCFLRRSYVFRHFCLHPKICSLLQFWTKPDGLTLPPKTYLNVISLLPREFPYKESG